MSEFSPSNNFDESESQKDFIEGFNHYTIEKSFGTGGSGGNLPKWVIEDENGLLWVKGRSSPKTYEPEVEVCASVLANLFGVPNISYTLHNIPGLSTTPVCVCSDYSNGFKVVSLYRYLISLGMDQVSVLKGADKFHYVESVLSHEDRKLHRSILLFDYIVGNKDRHLRNFDLRITKTGTVHNMVEMYDTGASLFSDESDKMLYYATEQKKENYTHSKPYNNPHLEQIKILKSIGYEGLLKQVKSSDITGVIHLFFNRKRASLLTTYVTQNAERLGLLC